MKFKTSDKPEDKYPVYHPILVSELTVDCRIKKGDYNIKITKVE